MRSLAARSLWLAAALLPGAVEPTKLAAQGCEGDETINGCWSRHFGRGAETRVEAAAEAKQAASDSAFLRLFGKLTGVGAGQAGGLASAVSDFLPLFSAIPTIVNFEESDLGVAIETNLPLYGQPAGATQPLDLGGTFKLRAELRAPEPYSPLLETVTEADRESVSSLLKEGLDQFDDVTLSILWNAEGTRVGRSFGDHVATLDAVLASVVQAVEQPSYVEATRRFFRILDDRANWDATIDSTKSDVCDFDFEAAEFDDMRLDCFREPFQTDLAQALVESALSFRGYLEAIDAKIEEVGFLKLADLLNNQPQFSLSADLQLRDEAVGPDGYGFAVRFEQGFANLNSLRSNCGGTIGDATCVQRYLARPDVIAALDRSDRVWASVELNIVNNYSFERTVAGTTLDFDQGESIVLRGSLGFGRQIRVDAQGRELARVDLSIEGELNEDDSGRNDRFVASATYTQKITDALTLPLGITYANKAEFLGDVDDRLGVHLGLSWRLRRNTPQLPRSN